MLEPILTVEGVALSSMGTGFRTWTLTIVVELGLSTLVACTTTRFRVRYDCGSCINTLGIDGADLRVATGHTVNGPGECRILRTGHSGRDGDGVIYPDAGLRWL